MPHIASFRRAVAAAVTGALALATPALAEPVKAGPATPDELAVIGIDGQFTAATERFSLNRISTTDGTYRGRIVFPSSGDAPLSVVQQSTRGTSVERTADGTSLTVAAAAALPGESVASTLSAWRAVRVNADATYTTAPLGTLPTTVLPTGVATVDGSRYWWARPIGAGSLFTTVPGEPATSLITGTNANPPLNFELADGTLYYVAANGVYRVPGGGLPTAPLTAAPELVATTATGNDLALVDTDGTGGVDTLYVARGINGLSKFVRTGDTWAARGTIRGNYTWIAARAVAGAVELYSSDAFAAQRIHKTVDTAEVGEPIRTSGPTLLALSPTGIRWNGLAFAPGGGFPADATPYPATPPRITGPATADAVLGSPTKATYEIEVADANTPSAELEFTVGSTFAESLPADRVTISGTGPTRTVTLDPIAVGGSSVTITVKAGGEEATTRTVVSVNAPAPHPDGHYYSGLVDISAALDVGDDHFLGVSDEVNAPRLFKKGVSAGPIATFSAGFPTGEADFEGVTRFGDTVVWAASHGNNRSGEVRAERRYLAFSTIGGSGRNTTISFRNAYTRLWAQWRTWDAANGHGLGANRLKFNTATVGGVLPNAPNGFNVEGLTMAPGSQSVAWFGMRAPTITVDGVERALILPVNNIDKLTASTVNAELGQPILLNLGGRSIRDIAKNAQDQYLITAGPGDTFDSIQNWALFTWDGNPEHDPQLVKMLPTNLTQIGAWEGIAEVPANLGPGSRVLLTADSGDAGIGNRAYGQWITLDEPVSGPAAPAVTTTVLPGALDLRWAPVAGADRYLVSVQDSTGKHVAGTPFLTTDTHHLIEPLSADMQYTAVVLAENTALRTPSTPFKGAPAQGPRTPVTIGIEAVGTPVWGEPMKVVATLSDPAAKGTVAFSNNGFPLGDASQREVPVVNGKAELSVDTLDVGFRSIRAVYTSANTEQFLSSEATQVVLIESKRVQPALELVSITGDRVAGRPLTLKFKLLGYTKDEIYPGPFGLSAQVQTRVNGAATPTFLPGGDINPTTGELTVTVSNLAAGQHRISAYVYDYGAKYNAFGTDEIPVQIAPAGSPVPAVPQVKRPQVFLTVSGGPRLITQPLVWTARVSDPTLQGTVVFTQDDNVVLSPAVPVVDGVATWTGIAERGVFVPQVRARFEPAAERDTTASPVSGVVAPLLGVTEAPPINPTATTTTLAVEGSRVAGASLTAKVTVAPAVPAPFAETDAQGYVELTDRGTVVGLARVLAGQAEVDLTGLGTGRHALVARFVSSDEHRATSSASAAQAVDVVVKTDTDGDAGGTVAATLALTLGTAAKFEPFVPGVAKEYTAATTANVISTAGDAALTVSEPGHLTNGAFALAQPLRVELAPATWTAPVSNANVDITFKQAIGATDPLRTGTYSKTLTITLSTTTP